MTDTSIDTTTATLEARVAHLEDLEAIRRTFHEYCFGLDAADWERFGDLFTEDGTYEQLGLDGVRPGSDTIYRGREEVVEGYKNAIDGIAVPGKDIHTGHYGANLQIDLDGDSATTLGYFFEIVASNIVLCGTYQHKFRRDPDRWRIAAIRIAIRYQAKMEASDFGGLPLPEILAKAF